MGNSMAQTMRCCCCDCERKTNKLMINFRLGLSFDLHNSFLVVFDYFVSFPSLYYQLKYMSVCRTMRLCLLFRQLIYLVFFLCLLLCLSSISLAIICLCIIVIIITFLALLQLRQCSGKILQFVFVRSEIELSK